MTIVEFLLARIADDEKRAHYFDPLGASIGPARLLAECAAKRAIIELYQTSKANTQRPYALDAHHHIGVHHAIRYLATVYADHPDYCEEWRP